VGCRYLYCSSVSDYPAQFRSCIFAQQTRRISVGSARQQQGTSGEYILLMCPFQSDEHLF